MKQRLSRGRKLLHQEVLAFVEGALERTNPGKAFTLAVLAMIPMLSTSAKAATLGAAAIKGGAMAKSAELVGLFNAVIAPVLGFLGPWLQYRAFLAAAKTDNERQSIRSYYHRLRSIMLAFALGLFTAVSIVPALRLRPERIAEQGAAPNGGPATPLASSEVTEGPPSVS